MKYVVDCSVAFQWCVAETDTPKAIKLRDGYSKGIHELLAPDLFPTEIANALLVAERRKRIAPGDSATFLKVVLQTLPIIHPALPDLLPRAHAIAASTVATVYDSLYVALAEREMCEFITSDAKLVKNLKSQYPFIVELSAMP